MIIQSKIYSGFLFFWYFFGGVNWWNEQWSLLIYRVTIQFVFEEWRTSYYYYYLSDWLVDDNYLEPQPPAAVSSIQSTSHWHLKLLNYLLLLGLMDAPRVCLFVLLLVGLFVCYHNVFIIIILYLKKSFFWKKINKHVFFWPQDCCCLFWKYAKSYFF